MLSFSEKTKADYLFIEGGLGKEFGAYNCQDPLCERKPVKGVISFGYVSNPVLKSNNHELVWNIKGYHSSDTGNGRKPSIDDSNLVYTSVEYRFNM